jgi:hypothetical protein
MKYLKPTVKGEREPEGTIPTRTNTWERNVSSNGQYIQGMQETELNLWQTQTSSRN